jgi:hypothetical protein
MHGCQAISQNFLPPRGFGIFPASQFFPGRKAQLRHWRLFSIAGLDWRSDDVYKMATLPGFGTGKKVAGKLNCETLFDAAAKRLREVLFGSW